jgi:hypothetical protein
MTVVIHPDPDSAVTPLSMTHMMSLTYILLVNFISNFSLALSLNDNRQGDNKFVGGLTT